VGEQAREIQTRLEELLFVDVPTRLMRLLLRLADEYGQVTPDGLLIDLPLTHQEVAELIGSTRETTSLAINQLQKQGLLERRSKRFLLPDPDALRGHLSSAS
jgi:CRP-like cAMP-binding protein